MEKQEFQSPTQRYVARLDALTRVGVFVFGGLVASFVLFIVGAVAGSETVVESSTVARLVFMFVSLVYSVTTLVVLLRAPDRSPRRY